MRRLPFTSTMRGNPVVCLILRSALMGAGLGLAFAVALVALDAHGIGHLITQSDAGAVAFVLLAGGFMVTFASLVAGGAVMSIGTDTIGRGGRPGARVPVRVHAEARRRSDTVQRRPH